MNKHCRRWINEYLNTLPTGTTFVSADVMDAVASNHPREVARESLYSVAHAITTHPRVRPTGQKILITNLPIMGGSQRMVEYVII